jgi:hypothetical protein
VSGAVAWRIVSGELVVLLEVFEIVPADIDEKFSSS